MRHAHRTLRFTMYEMIISQMMMYGTAMCCLHTCRAEMRSAQQSAVDRKKESLKILIQSEEIYIMHDLCLLLCEMNVKIGNCHVALSG